MFDLQHVLDLMEDGAFEKAASTLRQVVAQLPAYAPAYVLLARSYEALECWPEALATWQRAHFFAPNSPVVEAGLLRVLDRQEALPPEDFTDTGTSDSMDRMGDELLETIRGEDAASPAIHRTDSPSDVSPPPSPEGSEDGSEASEEALSPVEELARRTPDPDQPLPDDFRDLDRLIEELEGARIDPQPNLDDAPPPDLDNDVEDVVSETLARIYVSQKKFDEAARVYLRLASQEPARADAYRQKAAELEERARDGGN